MFWLGLIVAIICAFSVTALQLLPIFLGVVLMGIHVYGKKDLRVWILVLAITMALINIAIYSTVDVVFWGLIAIIYAFK